MSSSLSAMITSPWKYQLALWCQQSGIKVDGSPFDFDGHKYLWPIFLDRSHSIVWLKAAQMGATIWMALRSFHQALFYQGWGYTRPVNVGFYFPNEGGLNLMVKSRFEKIMQSVPDLKPYMVNHSRHWKPIGDSALYYFYMGGSTTKDSTPLMSIFFDEVRLMSLKDLAQAKKRVSHSELKYYHMVSTAGYPKGDIHHLFLNSDQKWWHTNCGACGYKQVLCLDFPECIEAPQIGPKKGQIYYVCKKCKHPIRDTQNGQYLSLGDENHDVSGYQVSQLISSRVTPKEIWTEFQTTDNIKEFYNGVLGIPYIDEYSRPVSLDILDKNINPLAEWRNAFGGSNYMGIDQMGGLNYAMIVQRIPGYQARRIVYFEIIEGKDPFSRCAELMEDYSIKVCACDSEPNANDALRFANRFGGRVFLTKYGSYSDMVRWEDHWRPRKELRKADEETFHKYRLHLDKFQSIERTLLMLLDGRVEWPDPDGLIQEVRPLQGGGRTPMPIMRTHAYEHFACAVKEKVDRDPNSSEYRWKWNFIKWDPHSLCALDYALRASERKEYRSILTI